MLLAVLEILVEKKERFVTTPFPIVFQNSQLYIRIVNIWISEIIRKYKKAFIMDQNEMKYK